MILVKRTLIKRNENLMIATISFSDVEGNEYVIEKEIPHFFYGEENEPLQIAMGCHEIKIRTFEKEEELERLNRAIEEAERELSFYRRYLPGTLSPEAEAEAEDLEELVSDLENRRDQIKNGIEIDELEINYSKCGIEIKWQENNEEKKVEFKPEIGKNYIREFYFSNLELIIENY
jgi:hypothetical protein